MGCAETLTGRARRFKAKRCRRWKVVPADLVGVRRSYGRGSRVLRIDEPANSRSAQTSRRLGAAISRSRGRR